MKDIKRQTEIRLTRFDRCRHFFRYDAARAQDTVERFQKFLEEHRNALVALQIL
jgi:hypothetical protein